MGLGFFLFPSVSLVVESRINSLGSQKLLRSDSELCMRTKYWENKTRSREIGLTTRLERDSEVLTWKIQLDIPSEENCRCSV